MVAAAVIGVAMLSQRSRDAWRDTVRKQTQDVRETGLGGAKNPEVQPTTVSFFDVWEEESRPGSAYIGAPRRLNRDEVLEALSISEMPSPSWKTARWKPPSWRRRPASDAGPVEADGAAQASGVADDASDRHQWSVRLPGGEVPATEGPVSVLPPPPPAPPEPLSFEPVTPQAGFTPTGFHANQVEVEAVTVDPRPQTAGPGQDLAVEGPAFEDPAVQELSTPPAVQPPPPPPPTTPTTATATPPPPPPPPVPKSVPKVVRDSVPKPVPGSVPEGVSEPVSEVSAEPASVTSPEAAPEPAPEFVSDPMPDPLQESAPEPEVEPVPESDVETDAVWEVLAGPEQGTAPGLAEDGEPSRPRWVGLSTWAQHQGLDSPK